MSDSEFQRSLFSGIFHGCFEFHETRTDALRFGAAQTRGMTRRLKDKLLLVAAKHGFVRRRFDAETATKRLIYAINHIEELERFYNLLQDDYSRSLLIALLKFKVLGPDHATLPLNNKEYWDRQNSIDRDFLQQARTVRMPSGWDLNRYSVQGVQQPIELHAHPMNILPAFCLENYAYRQGAAVIQAEPGDVVIDGGGGWGDVALYFADKVGKEGKVYCFEFVEENLEIVRKNVALNPHLADRIEIVPNALWAGSGNTISYRPEGPGTSLQNGEDRQNTAHVSTLSIDDFVRDKPIPAVHLIKLDVEGAELSALQGAEETIRAFRPKLAVSLYHKDDDFIVIPHYLDKLGLQYEFFLDHFTTHMEETVLFARPAAD